MPGSAEPLLVIAVVTPFRGADEDWAQIAKLRKRELYRRHLVRFDSCSTAELARRAIANLGLSSDDPVEVPPADPHRAARAFAQHFRLNLVAVLAALPLAVANHVHVMEQVSHKRPLTRAVQERNCYL